MRKDIESRVLREGYYIAETGDTVRKTATVFLYSKSTIHKDVTSRLIKIDKLLYERVRLQLDKNYSEKHIRGGESTRKKYRERKCRL